MLSGFLVQANRVCFDEKPGSNRYVWHGIMPYSALKDDLRLKKNRKNGIFLIICIDNSRYKIKLKTGTKFPTLSTSFILLPPLCIFSLSLNVINGGELMASGFFLGV